MKQTRRTRTKTNKRIRVKRRLGGSKFTRQRQPSDTKWRENIGTYHQYHHNITIPSPKIHKRLSPLSPLSQLSPSHHTTSARNISTSKLLGLATLVALGSIPGSKADLPRSEWLPQATDCVTHRGNWNAKQQICTNRRPDPSTDERTVLKGIECVRNGESFGPLGHCTYTIGNSKLKSKSKSNPNPNPK